MLDRAQAFRVALEKFDHDIVDDVGGIPDPAPGVKQVAVDFAQLEHDHDVFQVFGLTEQFGQSFGIERFDLVLNPLRVLGRIFLVSPCVGSQRIRLPKEPTLFDAFFPLAPGE